MKNFKISKGNIYWCGLILYGADLDTFEIINNSYAKDKNNVYWHYGVIDGADPVTFVILNNHYTKDKNHIYWGSFIVHGADSDSFMILDNNCYTKDKNNIYRYGDIIAGADPATFVVSNDVYSQDKNHIYADGKIIARVDTTTNFLTIKKMENNEIESAKKWLSSNDEALKAYGIYPEAILKEISETKEVPQTNEFVARAKGSTLEDLVDYLTQIEKDFERIDTQNTKMIAMAIRKILKKTEKYPYSIKDAAIKRYMQILGLDYYFLLEFIRPKEQDFNSIFAADIEDEKSFMDKNRAKYIQPDTITRCNLDKRRNCEYKNLPFPEDFDKQTEYYYNLCESLLNQLGVVVPKFEFLRPLVVENILKENIEVARASQVKENFYHQALGDGEEIEPEYETTSGFRNVSKSDAKAFWELRKSRCFSEYKIGKIIPIKNVDINDKRYSLIKKLTEDLEGTIVKSKDYTLEDFANLILI